jgi:hypothetical protein
VNSDGKKARSAGRQGFNILGSQGILSWGFHGQCRGTLRKADYVILSRPTLSSDTSSHRPAAFNIGVWATSSAPPVSAG